jgi:hypothetical protein
VTAFETCQHLLFSVGSVDSSDINDVSLTQVIYNWVTVISLAQNGLAVAIKPMQINRPQHLSIIYLRYIVIRKHLLQAIWVLIG